VMGLLSTLKVSFFRERFSNERHLQRRKPRPHIPFPNCDS
jgi:hypothetical protein